MQTILRLNQDLALFEEIQRHLMQDAAPSAYLNSIKKRAEFQAPPFDLLSCLQHTRQPPQHHPEGSVWNHTMLVVDEAAKRKGSSRDPRVFLWAALLHDIGKPPTTRMRGGRLTSYDHDRVGAQMAERFLRTFTDDEALIHPVSVLIRYHMHPLYVEKGLPFADIRGMREQTDVDEVALLGLCDRLGRLGSDPSAEKANLQRFLQKVSAQP
jgi:putative nucleotidyltransferase with HDIG domain